MEIKKAINILYNTIISLENTEECEAYFEDLLTKRELEEISLRYVTAYMLNNGVSYRVIGQKTGLSPRTIARIAYWLKNGAGGYRMMFNRVTVVDT
jgi:TrpR-related protein YerC/YecD